MTSRAGAIGQITDLAGTGAITLVDVSARLADPKRAGLYWAFSLSGHPAVTVPAGLPAGLQAIAAHHRDDLAVAVAGLAQVPLPDPPHFWPHSACRG